MSLSIEVQKKPFKLEEQRKITKSDDVFNLIEVQEIKDAIQEHLLFIGLDSKNCIRKINLIGVGTSNKIFIDSKDIVRTALLTASEKVILVHNHPSSILTPSKEDIHISNVTKGLLKVFNINLIDHIIVGEENYYSILENEEEYGESIIVNALDNALLKDENLRLKGQIELLSCKLQEFEKVENEEELE